MFKTLRRLLPKGPAWELARGSLIRGFFEALATPGDDVKQAADSEYNNLDPQQTDRLGEWEKQLGLERDPGLSESERRERLAARWSARGGQDPDYIERTLQAAGFDLTVHEWWVPDTSPPEPRDAEAAVAGEQMQMGSDGAQMGAEDAQMGGQLEAGAGYALVNNEYDPARYTVNNSVTTGDPWQMGDPAAQMGDPDVEMAGPAGDPVDVRPYYLYLGAPTFGEVVNVPSGRRRELETLLLSIAPTQQWLILFVRYD